MTLMGFPRRETKSCKPLIYADLEWECKLQDKRFFEIFQTRYWNSEMDKTGGWECVRISNKEKVKGKTHKFL